MSILHSLFRPGIQCVQRGQQRFALFSQVVFYLGRNGIVLGTVNEAVFLQLHQTFGQHGRRDADHFSFQLVVADHLFISNVPQDGQLPFLPNELHGVQDRALGSVVRDDRSMPVRFGLWRVFPYSIRAHHHGDHCGAGACLQLVCLTAQIKEVQKAP